MKRVTFGFGGKRRTKGNRTPLILIIVLLVFSSSVAIANPQVKGAASHVPGIKSSLGKLQGIYNQLMAMQGAISAVVKEISGLTRQLIHLRGHYQDVKKEQLALKLQLRAHQQTKPRKPSASAFTRGGELDRDAYNAALSKYNENSANWQSDLNRIIQQIGQIEKKLQNLEADIKKTEAKINNLMRILKGMEQKINNLLQQALSMAQSAQKDPTLSSQEKGKIQSQYRKIKLLSKNMNDKIRKHLTGNRSLLPTQKRFRLLEKRSQAN